MQPKPSQSFAQPPVLMESDNDENSAWVELARTHWLGEKKPSEKSKKATVIKRDIWDVLQSRGFDNGALLVLERLHVLEEFLWPTYTEDASNYHVLLIALFVATKQKERLPIWDHFRERADIFPSLFRRVLSMNLDNSLPTSSRLYLLSFLICAFQSLENALTRRECAPLVSISIWYHLHSGEARNKLLDKPQGPKRPWRIALKKFNNADESGRARLSFDRSWLFSMLVDFLRRLNADETGSEELRYAERFIEFLIDLDSQLPTRRYVNSLLKDLNVLAVIRLSKLYNNPANALFRDFYALLRHFMQFSVDDQSGEQLAVHSLKEAHQADLSRLQQIAIKYFDKKLTLLALTNYGSINHRSGLESHLTALNDNELEQFASLLGFRTEYPSQANIELNRPLLTEIIFSAFEKRPSFHETAGSLSILPTEKSLYDPALARNEQYDGADPLAIPKLNLQYLSVGDFLFRSFLLYRSESFYEIRQDLESVVKRMKPRFRKDTGLVSFEGFSKMAVPISRPAIVQVAQPKVGTLLPAYVRSEVLVDTSRLGDRVRSEWESLRPDDVVFLLAVQPEEKTARNSPKGDPEELAIQYVRTAEIVQVLDERGNSLREMEGGNENRRRTRTLRLVVNLDAAAHQADIIGLRQGQPDVYELINVVARRKGRENNFQPILQTIQKLTTSNINLPSWLRDVFLGYGDPNSVSHDVEHPDKALKLNNLHFTPAQAKAIASGSQPGLSVIVGPPGTGKTDVATQIINNIYHDHPKERTLLIAHSNQALNQLFEKIIALDIDERHLLRLGRGEEELDTDSNFGKFGRVETLLERRTACLQEVNRLAYYMGAPGSHGNSCETASYFNTVYVQPAWTRYWDIVHTSESAPKTLIEAFPFHYFFATNPQEPLFDERSSSDELMQQVLGYHHQLDKLFVEIEDIRPLEILRQQRDRANYLLVKEAKIIAMTTTHAAMHRQEFVELGLRYDNVVMEEAAQITEIESFIPCALARPDEKGEIPLKRLVLLGDHLQNSPIVQNLAFRQYANFEQSMFLRFVRLGVPTIVLDQQGRSRPSIAELFKWRYEKLDTLPSIENNEQFKIANAGLRYDYQFINVPDYQDVGEREPSPFFIQNLGEAEYAVALYQYMRLLGYPASKITILATYAGQQALIHDVLNHRCAKNALFGLPKILTTVDKYQGEQNDYVILSMTRTKSIGYLRDVRRLTVALSRARFGLYILGRREVFESCLELKPAFDLLFKRPDKLRIIAGELFPTQRSLTDDVQDTVMEGVEHLGQYVHQMTEAKVKSMVAGKQKALQAGAGEGKDVDGDVEMQ